MTLSSHLTGLIWFFCFIFGRVFSNLGFNLRKFWFIFFFRLHKFYRKFNMILSVLGLVGRLWFRLAPHRNIYGLWYDLGWVLLLLNQRLAFIFILVGWIMLCHILLTWWDWGRWVDSLVILLKGDGLSCIGLGNCRVQSSVWSCVGSSILVSSLGARLWLSGSMGCVLLFICYQFLLAIQPLYCRLLHLTFGFLSLWVLGGGLAIPLRLRILHRFDLSEAVLFGDDFFAVVHSLLILW